MSVRKNVLFRVVSAGLLALTAAGCVARTEYDRLLIEYESMKQAKEELEIEYGRQDLVLNEIEGKLALAEGRASDAESARSTDLARLAELEAQLERFSGLHPGVESFVTPDGFGFRVADSVLFDPGSATLKTQGKSALAGLAREIVKSGYTRVRIDGHTDSDPVVKTKDKWPLGNHELSMARALAVYEYMVKEAKVPSESLALAAYGPNEPAVKGQSDAAKAKNRRVEIHVSTGDKT